MAQPMASIPFEVVVRGGDSRQVVAAVAIGLWRAGWAEASGAALEDKEIEAEVQARAQRIQPVLKAKVAAAAQDRVPCVDGGDKAMRNAGEHDLFGEGAESLHKSGREAKKPQRQSSRRAIKTGSSSVSKVDDGDNSFLVSALRVQEIEPIGKAITGIHDGSVDDLVPMKVLLNDVFKLLEANQIMTGEAYSGASLKEPAFGLVQAVEFMDAMRELSQTAGAPSNADFGKEIFAVLTSKKTDGYFSMAQVDDELGKINVPWAQDQPRGMAEKLQDSGEVEISFSVSAMTEGHEVVEGMHSCPEGDAKALLEQAAFCRDAAIGVIVDAGLVEEFQRAFKDQLRTA
ncbi:unnamed protein product [Prorocentrum cordatum]|uniref:Uncharacterized protein n=1 Tax=Prorocentrum cordatum TaxID=2364126 RepID=A0ABN9QAD2_9DINO|nr:unnamed protein product [Polarella glacialis]